MVEDREREASGGNGSLGGGGGAEENMNRSWEGGGVAGGLD